MQKFSCITGRILASLKEMFRGVTLVRNALPAHSDVLNVRIPPYISCPRHITCQYDIRVFTSPSCTQTFSYEIKNTQYKSAMFVTTLRQLFNINFL